MAEVRQCGNKQVHQFHGFHEVVEVVCSGRLRCGAWAHREHTFEERQAFWCRGICGCGSGRLGDHGPGEHK